MRALVLVGLGTLFLPTLAQAQTAEIQEKLNYRLREQRAAVQQETMYENIEIMRRILQRGLGSVYAPQSNMAQFFTGIGNPNVLQGDYAAYIDATSGAAQLFDAYAASNNLSNLGDYAGYHRATANQLTQGQRSRSQSIVPAVEGVYLRGQGVVYTVTLPAHERVLLDPHSNQYLSAAFCTTCHVDAFKLPAEKAPSPDKLPSLWEQTRREVKGQPKESPKQPAADAKKLEVCGPGTIGEAVLRLLADNGKNLALTGKESVTVVITFRPAAGDSTLSKYYRAVSSNMGNEGSSDAKVDPTFTGRVSDTGVVRPAAGEPAVEPAGNDKREPRTNLADSWKQSYESLGDLHMRQKHYAEAIEAFKRALDQKPEQKTQEVIRGKLLDALKAQLDIVDAALAQSQETQELRKKLLDSAAAYLKGLEAEFNQESAKQAKKSSLPAKLIISAPKELLDQIGQGKVSFEDFKKGASVEYLTFGAAK